VGSASDKLPETLKDVMGKTSRTPQKPVELMAVEQAIFKLRADIEGIGATIKAETRAAEVERDGFDKYDPTMGPLLADLNRHGVPKDRAETFARWQRGRLAELTSAQTEAKRQLADLTGDWQLMVSAWQRENAETLHEGVGQRIEALHQQIADRQKAQHDLRVRIGQINSARLQRAELSESHNKAVAAALATGEPVPEAPALPEVPAESVLQVESAIKLIAEQIEGLRLKLEAAQHERRTLSNMIAGHRADRLMVEIRALAKERGVGLADVRDRLTAEVGPGFGEAAAKSGEAAALASLQAAKARVAALEGALDSANSRLSSNRLARVAVQTDDPAAVHAWGAATVWPQQQSTDAMLTGRI
jgi:hypothetical protein